MSKNTPIHKLPIIGTPTLSGYTIYEDLTTTSIISMEDTLNLFDDESKFNTIVSNEIDNRISGDTALYNIITGLTTNISEDYLNISGGTINGDLTVSGGTIYGDGSGLFNIPSSGVTGLQLDRLTYSGNTANMSESGLTVNTDIYVEGIINGDGSGLFNVPASGVTGLLLDRLTYGDNTAIMSDSGFTINTGVTIQGNLDVQTLTTNSTGLTTNLNSDLLDGYHLHQITAMTSNYGDDRFVNITGDTMTGGLTISGETDIYGTLRIVGDIIQSGSTYETHAEQIYTTKDYIILRSGATVGLLNGEFAGFEAVKYDGVNNGQLVFDKDGVARVGDVGTTQPLATREETPTDGYLTIWNSGNTRFETIDPLSIGISTDTQNALDLKLTKNSGITGGTFTKITYDSKGLVTSGQTATTNDIPDSIDKRYVTDALHSDITHTNRNVIDQLSDSGGTLYYNGNQIGNVLTDATLTGDGTALNPLHVVESVPTSLAIFKQGLNNTVLPQIFKWTKNLTVSSVQLMSNCGGINVTVDGNIYNQTSLVGVTINSGVELTINDMTILSGQNNANAIIIF